MAPRPSHTSLDLYRTLFIIFQKYELYFEVAQTTGIFSLAFTERRQLNQHASVNHIITDPTLN